MRTRRAVARLAAGIVLLPGLLVLQSRINAQEPGRYPFGLEPDAIRHQYTDNIHMGPFTRTYRNNTVQDCIGWGPGGVCLERPYPWTNEPWSVSVQGEASVPTMTGSLSYNLRTGNPELCVGRGPFAATPVGNVGYSRQECWEYDRELAQQIRDARTWGNERQPLGSTNLAEPQAAPVLTYDQELARKQRLAREYEQLLQNTYNPPVEVLADAYRQQGLSNYTIAPITQRYYENRRPSAAPAVPYSAPTPSYPISSSNATMPSSSPRADAGTLTVRDTTKPSSTAPSATSASQRPVSIGFDDNVPRNRFGYDQNMPKEQYAPRGPYDAQGYRTEGNTNRPQYDTQGYRTDGSSTRPQYDAQGYRTDGGSTRPPYDAQGYRTDSTPMRPRVQEPTTQNNWPGQTSFDVQLPQNVDVRPAGRNSPTAALRP